MYPQIVDSLILLAIILLYMVLDFEVKREHVFIKYLNFWRMKVKQQDQNDGSFARVQCAVNITSPYMLPKAVYFLISVERPLSSRCELPVVAGPCKARILRYYFNRRTGRCETFFYGGCCGNANNFETLSACTSICQSNSYK